jgi:hypothetical protein
MHQAHLSLYHNVISCSVAVGSSLTVASDGGIYKGWVYLRDSFIIKLVLRERTGQVVLHEDVAFLCEFVQDGYAFWVVER